MKAALLQLCLSIFVLLGAASSLFGVDSDLQSAVASQYERQVLILRHPVQSNSQKYDAAGNLIGKAEPGAWTAFGGIEITKVRLSGDTLFMEGTRRIFGYDSKQHTMLPFKIKDKTKVRLELALPAPLTSAADADTAINRIFTRNDDELIASVPDYWRPFLQKLYKRAASGDTAAAEEKPIVLPSPSEFARGRKAEPMMVNGKLVKPPHVKSAPEPSYEEFARKMRLQGTMALNVVIDKEGNVQNPVILRPLGAGLDEKAIEAVRHWKFDPGTTDGKPVSVQMVVEITFNLW